jgi:hypothetical protein
LQSLTFCILDFFDRWCIYAEKEKSDQGDAADNVLVEISGEVLKNWRSRSSIPLSLGCCDG